jgi:hypothetical protein
MMRIKDWLTPSSGGTSPYLQHEWSQEVAVAENKPTYPRGAVEKYHLQTFAHESFFPPVTSINFYKIPLSPSSAIRTKWKAFQT